MCQLRCDILRKKKKVEIEKSVNTYKRSYIAIPIQSDDENDDYEDVENDRSDESDESDEIVISDDCENEEIHLSNDEVLDTLEDNDSSSIYSTEQWERIIQEWMDMTRDENLESEIPMDFIAVDRTVHPADDPLAKWDLVNIFNEKLESPDFVNELII
jgi:hypothetical protein